MRKRPGALNRFDLVFTSPIAVRSTEPRWPLVKVSLNELCHGDNDRLICIQVVSPSGKHWGITRPITVSNLLEPGAMFVLQKSFTKTGSVMGQI